LAGGFVLQGGGLGYRGGLRHRGHRGHWWRGEGFGGDWGFFGRGGGFVGEIFFVRVVGGEEGAGLGWGVVAAVGLEAAEFLEGSVHHALQALFGGEEAFEGAIGAGAVVFGVVGGGAEGAGDEEAGGERFGRELDGVGEGREGGVVVVEVVVFPAEFFELLVLVFDRFAEVGFFHEGEEVVGGLEAAETPGDADDALGEGEFEGVHGAEALEEGIAVGVEEGFGFAGEEEVGGVGVVGGGVLGGGAFAGGGFGAGGALGVGAVGGCAAGGAG
jgi:hypothetical protein